MNRHTVRRAIAELRAEGAVRVVQGQGTFVEWSRIAWRIGTVAEFVPYATRQGRRPETQILTTDVGPCSPPAACELSLETKTPVLRVAFLRALDGAPWVLERRELPWPRFAGLPGILSQTRSMTASLARLGAPDIRRGRCRISCGLPTEEDASLLCTRPDRPAFTVEFVDSSPALGPVSWSQVIAPGDRMRLLTR